MIRLIANEFWLTRVTYFRYLPNSAVSLGVLLLLFYGMFLGAGFIAGPDLQFGTRLTSLVVGFVAWTMVIAALSSIADDISSSASTGVLEQIFLAPHSSVVVYSARAAAGVVFVLCTNAVILLIVMLLTGVRPEFPTAAVAPVASLLMGAYGLGFLLGALALQFKNVSQLVNVMQFALLFLVVAPFEQAGPTVSTLAAFLPIHPATGELRALLALSEPVTATSSLLTAANGLAYLALGLVAFGASVRTAKKRGVLAGY